MGRCGTLFLAAQVITQTPKTSLLAAVFDYPSPGVEVAGKGVDVDHRWPAFSRWLVFVS